MQEKKNIIELYTEAENFYLCFSDKEAETRENEVRNRGKRPEKIRTGDRWTVFQLNN